MLLCIAFLMFYMFLLIIFGICYTIWDIRMNIQCRKAEKERKERKARYAAEEAAEEAERKRKLAGSRCTN